MSVRVRLPLGRSVAPVPAAPTGAAAPAVASDTASGGGAASFAETWAASYGPSWWLDLLVLGVLVFALGAIKPLDDPDLPMHLATGAWIVQHRAVPFVEPFAWTRAGAPFFAYSWAAEVVFYLVLDALGPVGLHLLNGALVLAAAVGVLVMGHTFRWRPWVSLVLAAFGVAVATMVVPSLRPQLALLSLVPLAWACAERVLRARSALRPALGLLAVSALAANTHLFFVITAAPVALVYTDPPAQRRRSVLLCAAIGLGWLVTPYALVWPAVFALNLGHNALLAHPSPIAEFGPGFSSGFFGLVLGVSLALIPFGLPRGALTGRQRLGYGAMWLVGLVAFAYAYRLLLAWWLIVLPAAAVAVAGVASRDATPERSPRAWVRRASYGTAVAMLAVIVVHVVPEWRREGGVMSRRLPSIAAPELEPLLDWLQCNTVAGAHGRIFTWFNYGSYLAWRLPAYSASVDGRTIFPDSVADPEAYTTGWLAPRAFHTWSSADLAILPRRFDVGAILDTASDWKLAAWTYERAHGSNTVGLWVRRDWWAREGRTALPQYAHLQLDRPDDARGGAACGPARPALAGREAAAQ